MSLPGQISLLARMPTPSSSQYGNVDGPSSSTNNALVIWDGTTGKLIKNSTATYDNTTLSLPNTATGGFVLNNVADQTTNYERLEALWSGNVAFIRTARSGTGTQRQLRLETGDSGQSNRSAILLSQGGTSPKIDFIPDIATNGTVGLIGARIGTVTYSATSGSTVHLALTPTYNQASGTAANTDLLINRTQTAVGSGAQYLIQAQTGGNNMFVVSNVGNAHVIRNLTVGSDTDFNAVFEFARSFTGSSQTTSGVQLRADAMTFTDSSTAGSGTAASAVFNSFAQPTLAAANATVTTTDAATVYIANAPAAGTNQTITNSYALWVDAGNVRLDGALITTPQALSGAGAVNVTTSATNYTSTGGAQALTLANGTDGQIKTITHVVDGGSGVLTPTTAIGFTTVTFTNVGDSVTLRYTSAGWAIIGIFGAVAA